MKVIDPGHVYGMDSIDGGEVQFLRFVKREGERYPGNVGSHPGVTMQEVTRALIDRARYVNNQIPCVETEIYLRCMQIGLAALEQRHARVKGRYLHLEDSLEAFEKAETCGECGHIACLDHPKIHKEDSYQ